MGILKYIGGLVLAGIVGWGISVLLSLPGRSARERKQDQRVKEAARAGAIEGIRLYEEWQAKHPNAALPVLVREQIAIASATVAATHVGVATLHDPTIRTQGNPPTAPAPADRHS